jgi:type I restriction enzyme S subunit
MSFPKYPKYKDSGVEWLGDVPEHWGSFPLKYIATIKTGYAFSSDDFIEEGIPVLRIGDINTEGKVDLSKAQFLPDNYSVSNSDVLVKKGDIVMAMTGATIGKAGLYLEPYPSLLNQRVCLFRVKQPNLQGYLWWILTAAFYADHITLESVGGAQPNISDYKLLQCAIPTPSSIEQTLISTFLDAETTKIDTLITEQKRLIELLKEKRQAVISHAVTKGLNPDAPMKDSGVEWLGEVPAHWEILKGSLIGRLFGSEQVPEELVCSEGDLPFIKVGSMSLDSFEVESWDWFVDRRVADQYKPRSTYIVFPKRGAAIFLNKVNIVERPSLIDPNLMGWEIGRKAVPKFVAYTLKLRKLEELADVSTVPQINNKHIVPERFPIPPLEEQSLIVFFLDQETAKFDTLTTEAHRAIALLQERRTALISAAVTGQIDVRQFIQKEPS